MMHHVVHACHGEHDYTTPLDSRHTLGQFVDDVAIPLVGPTYVSIVPLSPISSLSPVSPLFFPYPLSHLSLYLSHLSPSITYDISLAYLPSCNSFPPPLSLYPSFISHLISLPPYLFFYLSSPVICLSYIPIFIYPFTESLLYPRFYLSSHSHLYLLYPLIYLSYPASLSLSYRPIFLINRAIQYPFLCLSFPSLISHLALSLSISHSVPNLNG